MLYYTIAFFAKRVWYYDHEFTSKIEIADSVTILRCSL